MGFRAGLPAALTAAETRLVPSPRIGRPAPLNRPPIYDLTAIEDQILTANGVVIFSHVKQISRYYVT